MVWISCLNCCQMVLLKNSEEDKKIGIPYGFGGIARLGCGDLPAERIIMEHYRLGSSRAILSRSFCNTDLISDLSEVENVFRNNMWSLREYEDAVSKMPDSEFVSNQAEIEEIVEKIVKIKRCKR